MRRRKWSNMPAVVAQGLALIVWICAAQAQTSGPFAPKTSQKPKIVRLLAFSGLFDPHVFEVFEQATGYAVAYDVYSLALEIPDKWKDGPYDLVVLPGPGLAKRIAAGALEKLDKTRLPNARGVQSLAAQKLGPFDPAAAYGVLLGWAPYGLIYDERKVSQRLGGAPNSWSALLDVKVSRRLADCGVVGPNARDAMFLAAWRLIGVDPARLRPLDVRSAGFVLGRAKPGLQDFDASDPVGALARGAACLTLGTPGEAAAADARAKAMAIDAEIGFSLPKEGGGVELEALAIPRDAPNRDVAYRLLDFLLTPDIARANAEVSGLNSSVSLGNLEMMGRLWPLGAFDDAFSQAMETEWTHLRTGK